MKRNEMKYRSLTEYYRYHEIMSAPDDIEAGTAGRMSANVPPEPEVGKGFRKPVPETTFVERVAGGVAALAIVTVLIAMIGEQSIIVILGCILSAIVAPYAYYQQTLLTDIRTLKETKRAFQSEVNRLEDSNKRLAGDIDNMTESVNRLEEIDTALQVITNSQGQSVETFRKQVEESKTILKQITQSNHKATVLQNLLTVIFRSDGSG